MYYIWAQYKHEVPEIVDSANDIPTRDSLIEEYREEFGPEYTVYWTKKGE